MHHPIVVLITSIHGWKLFSAHQNKMVAIPIQHIQFTEIYFLWKVSIHSWNVSRDGRFLFQSVMKTHMKINQHTWNKGPVQKGAIESRSESRFGSASGLVLWFELCAFTSIATAVPIKNRICALRASGNILFLLRWLTHAWLQHTFPKCARTSPQNQAF